MKKMMWGVLSLFLLTVSCSKDNTEIITDPSTPKLVTPQLRAFVDSPLDPQIPMTGILEVFPCKTGTSIYFGNYINNKLTVFNGFYPIEDGHIYEGFNRLLSLPEQTYNMVYWGTPVYEDPIYSSPSIVTPGLTIGADLSSLYLTLRKNIEEDTYNPVYDLVYAVEETDITYEDLSASLKRVVAGLKVSVTTDDSSAFSPNITNMEIRIGSIAEKLNYYTAEPENKTKTVKFELVRSEDGKQMTNGTVMLFPSANNPKLELRITLKDGTVRILTKNINTTLSADTRLTLNIVLGDIIIGEGSGNFTIEGWNETSETIEFPIVY